MASTYLVVHVGKADDIPSSSNSASTLETTTTYYDVELRFNGQSERTGMKENPRWDHIIHFPMKEQQGHHPYGGLHLEAAVYRIDVNVDEMSNLESLVGKAVVDETYFDSHSSDAVFFHHDLLKSSSGGGHPEGTSLGPVVSNGKLTLRVFHSAADDKTLLGEIEDTNRDGNKIIYNFLFSGKDHCCDGEADKTSSVVVADANDFALRRPDDDHVFSMEMEINQSFDHGEMVERMHFLFVVVVKARELPDVDAYGRLDPFVEVNFGAYNKGITKCLKRDANPEWNKTFAFSLHKGKSPPSSGVDVLVKDKDLLRDELVGKLYFYLKDIPVRHPDDAQPEPTWHPLMDQDGKATVGKASLLLAIWIGSQDDEAYRHAWDSPYGPKVYENPRLWCLRVTIVEVQGVVACDEDEAGGSSDITSLRDELFCKACLGDQVRKTRLASKTVQMTTSSSSWGSYEWMEDLVLVAAQPFFDSNLQVSVVAASSSGEQGEEVIGQLSIPLTLIDKHEDAPTPQWFDLKKPSPPQQTHPRFLDDGSVDMWYPPSRSSHMRIRLRSVLDGGYHIGHDPKGYLDDTRPADRQLWEQPIGWVQLGMLCAKGLQNIDRNKRDGRSTALMKPYCVAKYGDKWVRTRTIIGSSDPVFNEQYTWDVYDIATVLSVGVFDHCSLNGVHHKIGKVRIDLSSIESGRTYAHAYPLVTLSPHGVIKTGYLHLAVKISLPSTMNMLRMYARSTLPRMHYDQPLEEEQMDFLSTRGTLWKDAADILTLRLDRMEPPLRREVVAYLCNTDSCNNNDSFSMRKSKANFYRLTSLLGSLFVPSWKWFGGVVSWKNPLVTLLVHAILVLALWFHELVLPLVVPCCIALLGMWNYRFRPRRPPYVDPVLSHLHHVHPDELDEEFDPKPSQRDDDLVRMRYDRLRSVVGRVTAVIGDVATQLERIQSLLSWRDPRATAIFMLFLLIAAAAVYFVPCKLLVAVAGFYVMRHPRLRTDTTFILVSFFRRLPSKQDELI